MSITSQSTVAVKNTPIQHIAMWLLTNSKLPLTLEQTHHLSYLTDGFRLATLNIPPSEEKWVPDTFGPRSEAIASLYPELRDPETVPILVGVESPELELVTFLAAKHVLSHYGLLSEIELRNIVTGHKTPWAKARYKQPHIEEEQMRDWFLKTAVRHRWL